MAGDRQHKINCRHKIFGAFIFSEKTNFVLMAGDRQHKINCRHKNFGASNFFRKTKFVLMAGDRQHKIIFIDGGRGIHFFVK
jgi:hypothetical protein